MTVAVIDIRDSTKLTRILGEEQTVQTVTQLLQQMSRNASAHGSSIGSFLGDGIMTVWEHQERSDCHSDIFRTLRALREMQKSVIAFNERHDELPFPIEVGMGINTGYAMSTMYGGGDRHEQTVVGDTVNAAFRIESATKTIGQPVVMGDQTFDILRPYFSGDQVLNQHMVKPKGYDNDLIVWSCGFEGLTKICSVFEQETGE